MKMQVNLEKQFMDLLTHGSFIEDGLAGIE
jgi:hypothetical protein